jgi:hypothetical protein
MRQLTFRMLLVAAFAPWLLTAQIVDTGTISGELRDSSLGVIPQARVTLHNLDTGASRETTTNASGFYVSPPLRVGNYEVVVEVAGFSKTVQQVRLDVAQRAVVNFVLVPGAVSETVNVKAAGTMLGTETTTLSNLRDEKAISDLPLNTRNFSKLMELSTGVLPTQSQLTGNLPITEVRGPSAYSVNGSRFEDNHWMIDGIYDKDNHNGYGIIIYPPLDGIEEFRVETSVADARFGLGGGGTVNLITKSGTKHFHGGAFEFIRNSAMDARNFFDKAIPAFRMNQFGGSLGGPLVSRKDTKTFFFVDYQGERRRQGLTFLSTVPTRAFQVGDFSGTTTKVFDPLTQVLPANGTYSRTQFPGNVIPSSRIDKVGQAVINLFPAPNQLGIANNYLSNPALSVTSDKGDLKVDHEFSNRDTASVRYSHGHDEIFNPGSFPAPGVGGLGGPTGLATEPSNQAVLSETHIFSPKSINVARFGVTRINVRDLNVDYGQDLGLQLGIAGSNVPGVKLTSGIPAITITGATGIGESALTPAILVSTDFQFDDDVTLIRGRHTLEFGGQFLRLQYNAFQSNPRGSMTFGTLFTVNPASAAGTGLGLADVLLGKPDSGGVAYIDGLRGFRQTDVAFYGQDNFKVNDRLTLTLGLRYENFIHYPYVEVANRMWQFVDPSSTVQVGANGIPPSGMFGRNLNFGPRVGVAYRLGSKTVVRTAYGIFYSAPPIAIGQTIGSNPPGNISYAYANSEFDFPNAVPASAGFQRTPGAVAGSGLIAVDPHLHMPYTQQWNATVESQLPFSTLLTVSYVGAAGVHLNVEPNINQPVVGTTPIAQRRPYPLFSNIMETEGFDTSSYNALQVTAQRRLTKNLTFQVAFTYSHTLDMDSGDYQSFENNYQPKWDRGNSSFNVPRRLVASWTYELPFRSSGPLRQVVQGWQVNGIASFWDGLPFSAGSATNTLNNGQASRAQLVGPGNGSLPPDQRTIAAWFNVAAFTVPGVQQWGNVGRNTLTGPGTKLVDISVFKNFRFRPDGDRMLQFRAETFNVFNMPQFNNPAASIGAAGVGTITSSGAPYQFARLSREIQLALRLYF